MGLTKRELVEYVRIAEHNQDVAEETLNQQAENVKDWINVVRCKDCKHLEITGCYGECRKLVRIVKPWDFCSYGERREGE